jgi:hypothetical protein
MNHPLAVYTVVYLAILFVTVSIWGSRISDAAGDIRILLFAQGAFSLKLAIDDYVHFQGARYRLQTDLSLSLLIYLVLAASIAAAATGRGCIAALLFGLVFVVGTIWLCVSGFSGDERSRRIGWLVVNVIAAALLAWAAVLGPASTYTAAAIPLTVLFLLVIADFLFFGTLRRLANVGAGVCQEGRTGRVSGAVVMRKGDRPAPEEFVAEPGGPAERTVVPSRDDPATDSEPRRARDEGPRGP